MECVTVRQDRSSDDPDHEFMLGGMDPLERRMAVDKIKRLSDRFDKLDERMLTDQMERQRIRYELDELWHDLDDIAMIQADPLCAGTNTNMRVTNKRVLDEGEHARFLGRIYDVQLDEWDELDSLVNWRRLDLINPKHYVKIAKFWGILRRQDDEYRIVHMIMES